MPLSPGDRLGPYEILVRIGAGGMGEVYKAKDTRLDRTVAVKILREQMVQNPEFRQRFEREARAASCLNHPNICVLHDIGHHAGIDFLVMEYLEGETLAGWLEKDALPAEQVFRVAAQIADALAEAHQHGVYHRDLKPGNIILTRSGAKLLDFGLARLERAPSDVEMTKSLTAEGHIVGTLRYMAPEQLRGEPGDARSDIFAFGAVLYEMATGNPAFDGKSQADLIAGIMHHQPTPIGDRFPGASHLEAVMSRCLAKTPLERWQSARDLLWALNLAPAAASEPSTRLQPQKNRIGWIVATAVLSILLALSAAAYWLRVPAAQHPIRFSFPAFLGGPFGSEMPSVSPDGRHVAFASADAGQHQLWVRSLNSGSARPLEGTDGAGFHFWSPDGKFIAFFVDGKLKKIGLSGGHAQTIGDARVGLGGAWSREGRILLAPANREPLHLIGGNGVSRAVTSLDEALAENSHRFPHFFPDGRHFLYLARSARPENTALYARSLDSKESRRLLATPSNGAYAPSADGNGGFLLFVREGNLLAQPFNAKRLEFTGEAVVIGERVHWVPPSSFAPFSVSADGRVVAYRGMSFPSSRLYWFDRKGRRLEATGPPGQYSEMRLSPDGKRATVSMPDSRTGNRDIWVITLSTGVITRFTFNPANEASSVWSPDSSRIAYNSDGSGQFKIYEKSSSGTGEGSLVFNEPGSPDDWSPDGRWLIYQRPGPTNSVDLWLLPLAGDRKPIPLGQTEFYEGDARFSPDSRWVAYISNESGRQEVYVQSILPDASGQRGKWRISSSGGTEPRWSRDGKELFYVAPDKMVTAVAVKGAGSFEAGPPAALFRSCGYSFIFPTGRTYDTGPDGRFLINCLVEDTAASPITVIVNWADKLKQ